MAVREARESIFLLLLPLCTITGHVEEADEKSKLRGTWVASARVKWGGRGGEWEVIRLLIVIIKSR